MLSFSQDFPAPDIERWRSLVEKGLKGANFERRLVVCTEDGIRIPPLFTRTDELPEPGLPGVAPWIRGATSARAGWDIRSLCRLKDPALANRAILADLNGGATSILLDAAGFARSDLKLVLDGVLLDLATVYLSNPARDLADLIPAAHGLILLHDPVGDWAAGKAELPTIDLPVPADPRQKIIVNGSIFDDAGASDAEEIGLVIAAAIDFARQLADRAVGPGLAMDSMILGVTTNADFFAGIAKLRALRRLWGRVADVLHADVPPVVHATTSARMMTRYDASTNLLRTTIAAAAAGLGGAGAVTVLPHDHARGTSDPFAARMARNIQNVLLEESQLAQVADPAGGSWYVEQLTEQMARLGWDTVQRIEAAGGFRAACAGGQVQEILLQRREARSVQVAARNRPVIGVSEYPDAGETSVPGKPERSQRRLPAIRDGEPFEELRDHVLAGPAAPVFVLTIGPVARHNARLGFATGLFATVGLRCVLDADPVAFPGSGARLALIAGADEDYPHQAGAFARQLRATGADDVHVLGRPGVLEDELRTAGVSTFVFQGQDMIAYLTGVVERRT